MSRDDMRFDRHGVRPGYDRRGLLRAAASLAALGVTAAACGSKEKQNKPVTIESSATANGLHGTTLNRPYVEPDITLTDTAGKPFNLLAGTRNKAITLVFFGYTHCPDECPTTMADLAAALRKVSPAVRAKIATVFITTDPWRDTPPVLKAWLQSFNPAFIGLTGPFPTIQKAARQVAISVINPRRRTGNYEVDHGTAVLAFTPDHLAHTIYPSAVSPEEYAADLPKLVARAGP